LESIGYDIQKQTQEEQTTLLQEQIVLLQSLCEKITQEVELPAQAIAGLRDCGIGGLGDWGIGGLGDLLFRVRGIISQ
jgi:N-acetyl-anhydromuramyl-L-alanine amidase AmpD